MPERSSHRGDEPSPPSVETAARVHAFSDELAATLASAATDLMPDTLSDELHRALQTVLAAHPSFEPLLSAAMGRFPTPAPRVKVAADEPEWDKRSLHRGALTSGALESFEAYVLEVPVAEGSLSAMAALRRYGFGAAAAFLCGAIGAVGRLAGADRERARGEMSRAIDAVDQLLPTCSESTRNDAKEISMRLGEHRREPQGGLFDNGVAKRHFEAMVALGIPLSVRVRIQE